MNPIVPPPGLTDDELVEWARSLPAEDGDTFTLPEMAGVKAPNVATLHIVFPPGLGDATADYRRIHPYLWFACQHPDRAVDEAMLLDAHCPRCDDEWARRGLPVTPLPPLPKDAPIFR